MYFALGRWLRLWYNPLTFFEVSGKMLQMLDGFDKALIWTALAGLLYVVWTQAKARAQKRRLAFASVGEHLFIFQQVAWALVMAAFIAGSLILLISPILLALRAAPAPDPTIVDAYALPDGSVTVMQVQGVVQPQSANGAIQWRIGDHSFSVDSSATVHLTPGQSITACLMQKSGGAWQATQVEPATSALKC